MSAGRIVLVSALAVSLIAGASCIRSVDLGGSVAGRCAPCEADDACGTSGVCARLGGGSYCAALCPTGGECGDAGACSTLSTTSLAEVNACVPGGSGCDTAPNDAEADAPSVSCAGLAPPGVFAPCNACGFQSNGCQANGCYNGWFCETARRYCEPPPASCDAGFPNDGGFASFD